METTGNRIVHHLDPWDYVTMSIVLLLSTIIGCYFAWKGRKEKTSKNFFVGNKNMTTLPTTLSLLGSGVNAIMILGTTSEIYFHDLHFWYLALSFFISIPCAMYIFMPVFYDLKLISVYEYLEKRFNRTIRKIGSICFMAQTLTIAAVVLYAPSLALSQVTGLHLWTSIIILGLICTCYSAMGGLKAVMWTDALQILIMFGFLIAVVSLGCVNVGGLKFVVHKGLEGNRIRLSQFSLDPRIRYSFWSLVLGGGFTWMTLYCVGQAFVQRYLATPSVKKAREALFWNIPFMVAFISLACLTGLVVYATYWDCDPLRTGRIEKPDQLLPLYVMEIFGHLTGFPGLFVAGCFSGALSTISSNINSLSAVTMEDFVKPCFKKNTFTDKMDIRLSKILTVIYGVICILLVGVAQLIDSLVLLAYNLGGILGGPLLGLFSLGIFFPHVNSFGASCGFFGGLIFILWISIGAYMHKTFAPKNILSIAGCNYTIQALNALQTLSTENNLYSDNVSYSNISLLYPYELEMKYTDINTANETLSQSVEDDILPLYKISYMWYGLLAYIAVMIIGVSVNLLPGTRSSSKVDANLLSPLNRQIKLWYYRKFYKECYMEVEMKYPQVLIERRKSSIKQENTEAGTESNEDALC